MGKVELSAVAGYASDDAVNFVVGDKMVVALTGSSSSNLSAILRMIAGIEKIAEGSIFIDGERINDLPIKKWKNVAFIPSDYTANSKELLNCGLIPKMTVYDNLASVLKKFKLPKDQIISRTEAIAKELGLDTILKSKANTLSSSQRLFVAFGKAFNSNPYVYLFDNVFANLEPEARVQAREAICNVLHKFNSTAIFTTQDQAEAEAIADRVITL